MKPAFRGMQKDLEGLDILNLEPVIDVSGLDEGISTVPLHMSIPPGITLVEDVYIDVRIDAVETEPETSETEELP